MKRLLSLYMLLFFAVLCACQGPQTPKGTDAGPPAQAAASLTRSEPATVQIARSAATITASPSATTTDAATRALKRELKDHVSYAAFRQKALAIGWQPLPDKKCMANVAGADYQSFCPKNTDLAACRICKELPELSSCSGDGYCLMQFTHAGSSSVLQATTYGDFSRWRENTSDAGLMISGWELAPLPAK